MLKLVSIPALLLGVALVYIRIAFGLADSVIFSDNSTLACIQYCGVPAGIHALPPALRFAHNLALTKDIPVLNHVSTCAIFAVTAGNHCCHQWCLNSDYVNPPRGDGYCDDDSLITDITKLIPILTNHTTVNPDKSGGCFCKPGPIPNNPMLYFRNTPSADQVALDVCVGVCARNVVAAQSQQCTTEAYITEGVHKVCVCHCTPASAGTADSRCGNLGLPLPISV